MILAADDTATLSGAGGGMVWTGLLFVILAVVLIGAAVFGMRRATPATRAATLALALIVGFSGFLATAFNAGTPVRVDEQAVRDAFSSRLADAELVGTPESKGSWRFKDREVLSTVTVKYDKRTIRPDKATLKLTQRFERDEGRDGGVKEWNAGSGETPETYEQWATIFREAGLPVPETMDEMKAKGQELLDKGKDTLPEGLDKRLRQLFDAVKGGAEGALEGTIDGWNRDSGD